MKGKIKLPDIHKEAPVIYWLPETANSSKPMYIVAGPSRPIEIHLSLWLNWSSVMLMHLECPIRGSIPSCSPHGWLQVNFSVFQYTKYCKDNTNIPNVLPSDPPML